MKDASRGSNDENPGKPRKVELPLVRFAVRSYENICEIRILSASRSWPRRLGLGFLFCQPALCLGFRMGERGLRFLPISRLCVGLGAKLDLLSLPAARLRQSEFACHSPCHCAGAAPRDGSAGPPFPFVPGTCSSSGSEGTRSSSLKGETNDQQRTRNPA